MRRVIISLLLLALVLGLSGCFLFTPVITTFQGHVTDWANATPISGALVRVTYDTQIRTTFTDGQGAYSLTIESPGPQATLEFSAPNYEAQTVQAATKRGTVIIDVALKSGSVGTVTGRVTNKTTGAVISGAEVSILLGTTTLGPVLTDSNGIYTITGVPAGSSVTLQVKATGYLTYQQSITVQQGSQIKDVQLTPQ